MRALLFLCCLALGKSTPLVLTCNDINAFGQDNLLAQFIFDNQATLESPQCFRDLLNLNFFNSSLIFLNQYPQSELSQILQFAQEGMNKVNSRLEAKQKELALKKDFFTVSTPFQWSQSLTHVFLEVKYAHRHDAPGCSQTMDEEIEINEDQLSLSVLCQEANSKIRYMLSLRLWEKINPNESTHEHQAVGRHQFILKKQTSPARWRTLWAEDSDTKLLISRLWVSNHEKHVQQLWEFTGDSIWDFEGHQWMEDREEEYQEFQKRKLIPKKGPIPLEKKKKKGKGRKSS